MRVVYVGSLEPHGTCLQRMCAFRDLGLEVFPLDTSGGHSVLPRQLCRVLARADYAALNLRVDLNGLNRRLKRAVDELSEADLVWFDKPLALRPSTLQRVRARLPRAVLAAYSPDDQLNRANQSRRYVSSLPLFDVVFTTKSFNVAELQALGAGKVRLAEVGFDPATHRPVELSPGDRARFGAPASFVGTFEWERGEWLRRLAEDGVELKVWGNGWHRMRRPGSLKQATQGSAVYGDDYAKVICASGINLAFLRKAMRDRITTRSVEIPACGGFMLAERTQEHLARFAEDKEAAYFSSYQELRSKLRHYLANPTERERIGKAGRIRCLQSRYSNQDRLAELLGEVERIRAAATP